MRPEQRAKSKEQRAKGKSFVSLGTHFVLKDQLTASDGPDSASSFFWIHMPAI